MVEQPVAKDDPDKKALACYGVLFPAIMGFSCIGIYSLNNSPFEIYLTAIFGIIGFLWLKLECPPAPLLLGFVLAGVAISGVMKLDSRYPWAQ